MRIPAPAATRGVAPSHSPPDLRYVPGLKLARALGWFSIGLGLAELLKPQSTAEFAGLKPTTSLQFSGVRELICGAGILCSNQPAGWLWARVAGDVLDIMTLGQALADGNCCSERVPASLLAVSGVTALDFISASQLTAAATLED